VVLMSAIVGRAVADKACQRASVLGAVEGLGHGRGLWEVSALSASVRLQWLLPLGHINPGAIGWHAGLGGSVPVGMGPFETGKVQGYGFQHFSSIYRAVCGI